MQAQQIDRRVFSEQQVVGSLTFNNGSSTGSIPDGDKNSLSSNWWKKIHFIHFFSFIKKVRSNEFTFKLLELENIPPLPNSERIENISTKIETLYKAYRRLNFRQPRLFRVLLRVFRKQLFGATLLYILNAACIFGVAVMFLCALDAAENQKNLGQIFVFIGPMLGILLFKAYVQHAPDLIVEKMGGSMRYALKLVIFKKLMTLNYTRVNQLDISMLIKLIDHDLENFSSGFGAIIQLFLGLFAALGVAVFLVFLFGWQGLIPLAAQLGFWLFGLLLQYSSDRFLRKKEGLQEERIKLTRNLLESLAVFKMYGWEYYLRWRILKIRKLEANQLKKHRLIELLLVFVKQIAPFLSIFVTNWIYLNSQGDGTSTKRIFSTFFLFFYLNDLLMGKTLAGIEKIIKAWLIRKQIIAVLETASTQKAVIFNEGPDGTEIGCGEIKFKGFSGAWPENIKDGKDQRSGYAASYSMNEAEIMKMIKSLKRLKTNITSKNKLDMNIDRKISLGPKSSGRNSNRSFGLSRLLSLVAGTKKILKSALSARNNRGADTQAKYNNTRQREEDEAHEIEKFNNSRPQNASKQVSYSNTQGPDDGAKFWHASLPKSARIKEGSDAFNIQIPIKKHNTPASKDSFRSIDMKGARLPSERAKLNGQLHMGESGFLAALQLNLQAANLIDTRRGRETENYNQTEETPKNNKGEGAQSNKAQQKEERKTEHGNETEESPKDTKGEGAESHKTQQKEERKIPEGFASPRQGMHDSDSALESPDRNHIEDILQNQEASLINFDEQNEQANYPLPAEKLALKRLNLSIDSGTLVCVLGVESSGKTSFVMSLLNQIPAAEGKVYLKGKIAYVENEPILFPGTIKSNILFGRELDEFLYDEIILKIGLKTLFERLPKGDSTEVWTHGENIPNALKMYIVFARALYFEAEIYVLDNPFKHFEVNLARKLFEEVVLTYLKGKTIILTTEEPNFTPYADQIIYLDNGFMKFSGTYNQMLSHKSTRHIAIAVKGKQKCNTKGVDVRSLKKVDENDGVQENEGYEGYFENKIRQYNENDDFGEENEEEQENGEEQQRPELNARDKKSKKLLEVYQEDEDKTYPRIYFRGFLMYLIETVNMYLFMIYLLGVIVMNVLFIRYFALIGWQPQDTVVSDNTQPEYLLIIGIVITATFNLASFLVLSVSSSNKFHLQFLDAILCAKVANLQKRFLRNALTKLITELPIVDVVYPLEFNSIISNFIYISALLIGAWVYSSYLLIPSLFLLVIFVALYFISRRTMLDVIYILDQIRTPMHSFVKCSLEGLAIIGTYSQNNLFQKDYTRLCNDAFRPYLTIAEGAAFFKFYIHLITTIFIAIGLIITVVTNYSQPGNMGAAIMILLILADLFHRTHSELIRNINLLWSSNRLQFYFEIDAETAVSTDSDYRYLGLGWPQNGEIEFRNVFVKQPQTARHTLKAIRFKFQPGEKIACVGRMGSGKTALIKTLFRLREIDKWASPGSKIKISGTDIELVGLHLLRQSIAYIPKHPLVFNDTLRNNLDPFDSVSKEEILDVLGKLGLLEWVQSLPKGLDCNLTKYMKEMSFGKKMLLNVARAALRKNKILIIDEPSFGLEAETERVFNKFLEEEFKNHTILAVTRRLNTILNYDKLLVLSQGKVVEFDQPFKLLVNNPNDTEITNTKGHFAAIVRNTKNENLITTLFEACRLKYLDYQSFLKQIEQEQKDKAESNNNIDFKDESFSKHENDIQNNVARE